jgi:hypothetical protein
VRFRRAYVDALRKTRPAPPDSLLEYADSKGPLPDWLRKDFAAGWKIKAKVLRGDVKVTVDGPTITTRDGEPEVKFKACQDQRELKFEEGGKPARRPKWQLVRVVMTPAASSADQSIPSGWKVYSFNDISVGKKCELK